MLFYILISSAYSPLVIKIYTILITVTCIFAIRFPSQTEFFLSHSELMSLDEVGGKKKTCQLLNGELDGKYKTNSM